MSYEGTKKILATDISLEHWEKIMQILSSRNDTRDIEEITLNEEQNCYYFSMRVASGEAPVYQCINRRDCH